MKFIVKQGVYFIDNFLNLITMYRLVLYILFGYLLFGIIFSFFKLLPFNFVNLIGSIGVLIIICSITNKIFAKAFNAPINLESSYITALILILIITPPNNFNDFLILGFVGILSQAGKYILAIGKKHIFNPVAFAVLISSLFLNLGASWWIGNSYMLIPVLIGGLLVIRKLRRFSMVFAALALYAILSGPHLIQTILESPIFFFGFIMLTEPQTTPPKKKMQIIYGGLVGLMSVYLTPEIAILTGNVFSYLVSPKEKLILKLKEKNKIAKDTYEFLFKLDMPFVYLAGQYMEWTLEHKSVDLRGNRRYFTLASSPTEDDLRIGVKFFSNGSSFKKSLMSLNIGNNIVASQLSGEFVMPEDTSKKLVFLAGGIGITPFRSMIKYLLDNKEKRDIILFYSNKSKDEIVYQDLFDKAKSLGVRIVYVNTDRVGYVDESLIREKVADFKQRIFYISGPHSMVDAFEKILKNMGVSSNQIKIDFFPGYA